MTLPRNSAPIHRARTSLRRSWHHDPRRRNLRGCIRWRVAGGCDARFESLTVRRSACLRCGGWLEQLDEVSRWVNGEDLCAARTGHDLVAEPNPLLGEAGDLAVEVVDDEVD